MTFSGRKVDPKEAESLLGEVGLSHHLHSHPARLSFGEQQRVGIARALANHPQLLLADEPTGSLDPHNKEGVVRLLATMCEKHGCTLVLVSHEREVISLFSKMIPFLELNRAFQGRLGCQL